MGANFAKGLAFGSAIGGLASLLLAPKSGKETRNDITQEVSDLKNAGTGVLTALESVQKSAANLQSTQETLVPEFQKGLAKEVRAFKFMAEPRIEQIKEQVTLIEEKLQKKRIEPQR